MAAGIAIQCVLWFMWLMRADSSANRKCIVAATGYSLLLTLFEMIGYVVVLNYFIKAINGLLEEQFVNSTIPFSGYIAIPVFIPSIVIAIYYLTVAQRF